MARTSRILASVAALAIVASACGGSSSSDTTAAASNKVAAFTPVQAGKLTVCTDAPYEPFEFQAADKSWTGFDMDIMNKIASSNGLTLNVSVQGFDGILLKLAAKECDVVASSVTITPDRAKSVDFSTGYFDSYQSLLVRNADKDMLNSLASLKGKTIAVQTGTTGEAFAKANATGAKIQSYDDASAMFLALESSEVDGVLQDFPINASRAVKQGTSTVSVKFTEGQKAEQYGFAVEKGNASLLTVLNDTLATMKTDGSYDAIFAKYFGK